MTSSSSVSSSPTASPTPEAAASALQDDGGALLIDAGIRDEGGLGDAGTSGNHFFSSTTTSVETSNNGVTTYSTKTVKGTILTVRDRVVYEHVEQSADYRWVPVRACSSILTVILFFYELTHPFRAIVSSICGVYRVGAAACRVGILNTVLIKASVPYFFPFHPKTVTGSGTSTSEYSSTISPSGSLRLKVAGKPCKAISPKLSCNLVS